MMEWLLVFKGILLWLAGLTWVAFFAPRIAQRVVDAVFLLIGAPVVAFRTVLGNALRWFEAQINNQLGEFRKPELLVGGLLMLLAAGLILPGALATLMVTLLGALGVDTPFLDDKTVVLLQGVSFFIGLALHAALGLELLGVSHLGLGRKIPVGARLVLGVFVLGCLGLGGYTMFHLGEMRAELIGAVPDAMHSARIVQIWLPIAVEFGAVLAVMGATHSLPLIVALGLGLGWSLLRLIDIVLDIPDRILSNLRQLVLAWLDFIAELGERLLAKLNISQIAGSRAEPGMPPAARPSELATPVEQLPPPEVSADPVVKGDGYPPDWDDPVQLEPIDPLNLNPFGDSFLLTNQQIQQGGLNQ